MFRRSVFSILVLALLSMACGGLSVPQIGGASSVTFTPDPSRTATAIIGAEGGTITATAEDGTTYELVIPPDALDFSETISMTPISSAEGLSLSNGLAGAVILEPAGIIFYEPATLIITPSATLSGEMTLGFAYDGTGEEFHLQLLLDDATSTGYIPDSSFLLNATALIANASSRTLKLSVPSTRGYGAGAGSAQDIAKRLKAPRPSDPMDNFDEQLIELGNGERLPFMGMPKFKEALSQTFNADILPLLKAARSDPALADKAFLAYDRWLAYVNEFGLYQDLIDDIANAKVVIIDIIDKASERSADRCFNEKRPEEAFAMQRWIRYARKFLPNTPQIEEIQARISKCLTFKVTFHSVITEKGGDYGYSYELSSELTLKATSSTRATGSAPLVYTNGEWIGDNGCSFDLQGEDSVLDAEGKSLGLSITPVSRTSPAVNITFRYDPGVPVENTTMYCPDVDPFHWTTTAWQTYFSEMHAEELKGLGYEISSQITGAGSFTGWVINNTTTGPSGQAVNEDTQIEVIHTPSH